MSGQAGIPPPSVYGTQIDQSEAGHKAVAQYLDRYAAEQKAAQDQAQILGMIFIFVLIFVAAGTIALRRRFKSPPR